MAQPRASSRAVVRDILAQIVESCLSLVVHRHPHLRGPYILGSVATGNPSPSLDVVLIEVSVDFGARRAVEKLLTLWRSNYRYDWDVRFAFV